MRGEEEVDDEQAEEAQRKLLRKESRSLWSIGTRSCRAWTSSGVGGGSRSSSQTKNRKMGRKSRPTVAGIQDSDIPEARRFLPISLTIPLETMKEQLSPARSSSVLRRPSRYQTTKPQTIPGDTVYEGDKLPAAGQERGQKREPCANRINATRVLARFSEWTSEQTLMPRYLLIV